jgi:hypothetical protein
MSRTSLPCLVLLAGLVATASGAEPKPPPRFLCSLVGDELRLRIDKPHGRELAVVAPNGVLYLLAFEPRPGAPEAPRPPFERFATAHELSVDARSLEGWRLQAGRQRWEQVFALKGTYQFRAADDVVGDSGAPVKIDPSFCTVTQK